MTADLAWYVYHQQQQLGPFEAEQVKQLFNTNMISQEAYIFKIGWKEWLPIETAFHELGIGENANIDANEKIKRRLGGPRATIGGRVILHNNGQLIIGAGVNISATGIFIETKDPIFQIGETLNLTCKAQGLSKQFNVKAEVIRFSEGAEYGAGYGLKFVDLSHDISEEIQELVNAQNKETSSDDLNQAN